MQGQGQPFRGQTLLWPRTGMLEAKDQGHKRKYSPQKRSSKFFFRRSPEKNVFQKFFQALHKILTIQKIVLSSSRGQGNFRVLEASRPRPRTSKCVLEDVFDSDANGFAKNRRVFKNMLSTVGGLRPPDLLFTVPQDCVCYQ